MSSIVATYPRSGKTFFVSTLAHNTFIKLPYTHLHEGDNIELLKEYKNIITITRDPLESISSLITMEYTYYEELQKIYKENVNLLVKNKILERIKQYENFYKIIISEANIIIDFKKLVSETEYVVRSVAGKLNLDIKTNNFSNSVKDDPEVNFLKTSQNENIYKDIFKIIEKQDLTMCYELFNELQKRINI